jgi:hypothetical protein
VRTEAQGTLRANVSGYSFEDMGENGEPLPLKDLVNHVLDFNNLRAANFKNHGAAIDLGAEMKLLDRRLKLSLAVNDLGFIYWAKGNSIQGDLRGVMFEYRGYNADIKKFQIVKPDGIGITKTGNKGYAKMLATTLNIGAEYTFLDNLLGVGLLSHTRFWNRAAHSELTLTGTVRPAKWFTAALSHTLVRNKFGIFGFAFNFHPRGVNFFLGLDYIPTRWAQFNMPDFNASIPLRAKAINVHFGLAFTPGGPSRGWW